MAPPTNQTWETAIQINLSNCPFTTTQNVYDAGVTYEVWYKIVNDLGHDAAITTWFYGVIPENSSVYVVDYSVVFDPDGPNEEYFVDAYPNCASEFPIKSGTTYYVFVGNYYNNNVNPSLLHVNLSVVPTSSTYTAGHVIIVAASNSDFFANLGGLHAGIINPANGIIENTIPFFITSESGDVNSDGKYLFNDNSNNIPPQPAPTQQNVVLYDSTLTRILRVDIPDVVTGGTFEALIRTCNETKKFWVAISGYSGAPNRYLSVNTSGVASAVNNLTALSPGATLGAIAATNSESHLLVGHSSLTNNSIKKWNLSTLVWDTDFTAGFTDYTASDILVLPDNSVIISYSKRMISNYTSVLIKHFDSGGAEIFNYPITIPMNMTSFPRLGYSFDSAYFWFWAPMGNGTSILRKIKVSDGTYAFNQTTYNVYQTSIETATPALRYTSDSCPIIELYGSASVPVSGGGIYFINTTRDPISGLSTLKHDKYYDRSVGAGTGAVIEKKIPNPTIRTSLIGE